MISTSKFLSTYVTAHCLFLVIYSARCGELSPDYSIIMKFSFWTEQTPFNNSTFEKYLWCNKYTKHIIYLYIILILIKLIFLYGVLIFSKGYIHRCGHDYVKILTKSYKHKYQLSIVQPGPKLKLMIFSVIPDRTTLILYLYLHRK